MRTSEKVSNLMKDLKYVLVQPCCICIKEDNFDLKGSETDVAGIYDVCLVRAPCGNKFYSVLCK